MFIVDEEIKEETNVVEETSTEVSSLDIELEEMSIIESLGDYEFEGAKLEHAALTEADEAAKEEKKQGVVKYAAEKLKALKERIVQLFKDMIAWIERKFSKNVENKIEVLSKKTKKKNGKAKVKNPEEIVKAVEDLANECKDEVNKAKSSDADVKENLTKKEVQAKECNVDISKFKMYKDAIKKSLSTIYDSIITALVKLKNTKLVRKLMKAVSIVKSFLFDLYGSIIGAIKQFKQDIKDKDDELTEKEYEDKMMAEDATDEIFEY